jgi:hypothetical protein
VTALVSWLAFTALGGLGCGGDEDGAIAWSVRQAESVRVVRGLPVRVRDCRGIGRAEASDAVVRFRRFECVAGARLSGQPIDTVAVTYVLRPLSPYEAARPRYALSNVHFGGLGVP